MPRSKRWARAHGVAKSLGASRGELIKCAGCERELPRDAIAWLSSTRRDGMAWGYCGECWRTVSKLKKRRQPIGTGRRWSRQEILDALVGWANKHGCSPATRDWQHATHEHPTMVTVVARFGGWNQALTEAGLKFNPPGGVKKYRPEEGESPPPRPPFDVEKVRKMRKRGMSDLRIAKQIGTSPKTLKKWLGPPPPRKRKPRTASERRAARIAALQSALAKQEEE